MKTEPQKYRVMPGGETCRAINPYDRNADLEQNEMWKDFARENPELPLTEVMPEGETFSGVEVMQTWCTNLAGENGEWKTVYGSGDDKWQNRIAIKPLKAIEPVKDISELKANYANDHKQKPHVDVVENKETVETLKEAAGKSWEYNSNTLGEPINPTAFILGFGAGANWQQSQSIEGIVGFVLEWVADNLTTLNCKDPDSIKNMKSDIIKEYNNGK